MSETRGEVMKNVLESLRELLFLREADPEEQPPEIFAAYQPVTVPPEISRRASRDLLLRRSSTRAVVAAADGHWEKGEAELWRAAAVQRSPSTCGSVATRSSGWRALRVALLCCAVPHHLVLPMPAERRGRGRPSPISLHQTGLPRPRLFSSHHLTE